MTNPPTITPESELVARLRERDTKKLVDWNRSAFIVPITLGERDEIIATIERLASAHEAGRREGIEMAAKVAKQRISMDRRCPSLGITDPETGCQECAVDVRGGSCLCNERNEEADTIYEAIRALSPTPPGEKGERTPEEFAIEFGEYMAKAADRYLDLNQPEVEKLDYPALDEAHVRLRTALYEFRKRAKKTNAWLGSEKGERIPSGALTDAERAIIDRELARHEDSAAAAESTGAFESERFHDAMVKALRLAASPPPAKAEDGMREVYNPLIAAELRTIALSAGGGDSATGLLILGLLDQYETRIGGPRAISNQGDGK